MLPAQILLGRFQLGMQVARVAQLCGGKAIGDKHWNVIDVRDVSAAHRLAAESATDHARSAGGQRYQLGTADGQLFMERPAGGYPPGHPAMCHPAQSQSGLADRIHTMFPALDVGRLPASGARAAWTNNVDAAKARVVLGLVTRPVDTTIRDTVQSLLELGLVAPQTGLTKI